MLIMINIFIRFSFAIYAKNMENNLYSAISVILNWGYTNYTCNDASLFKICIGKEAHT